MFLARESELDVHLKPEPLRPVVERYHDDIMTSWYRRHHGDVTSFAGSVSMHYMHRVYRQEMAEEMKARNCGALDRSAEGALDAWCVARGMHAECVACVALEYKTANINVKTSEFIFSVRVELHTFKTAICFRRYHWSTVDSTAQPTWLMP